MSKKKTNLLMLLAAFIWGMAFVAQKMGMDHLGPYTFNSLRFFIGVLVLLPFILYVDKKRSTLGASVPVKNKKLLLKAALCCGIPLSLASAVQQVALLYSPAGKVGFLTALYILFVPLISIWLHKKIGWKVWIGIVIAVAGMYLLCVTEGLSLGKGDLLAILSGFLFAFQILFVDHFSPQLDSLKLSASQFAVAATVNGFFILCFEQPTLAGIKGAAIPLLYTGVLSCGVAYTLQVVTQKHAEATIAALIMSLESVFSVLGGWIILHQHLSVKELIGCGLMFGAIVLAQLPDQDQIVFK